MQMSEELNECGYITERVDPNDVNALAYSIPDDFEPVPPGQSGREDYRYRVSGRIFRDDSIVPPPPSENLLEGLYAADIIGLNARAERDADGQAAKNSDWSDNDVQSEGTADVVVLDEQLIYPDGRERRNEAGLAEKSDEKAAENVVELLANGRRPNRQASVPSSENVHHDTDGEIVNAPPGVEHDWGNGSNGRNEQNVGAVRQMAPDSIEILDALAQMRAAIERMVQAIQNLQ